MKVLLIVWLLGPVGPTMPVPIKEYTGAMTCRYVLQDWKAVSDKHQGMCLKVQDHG